jgi:hypothetical protein
MFPDFNRRVMDLPRLHSVNVRGRPWLRCAEVLAGLVCLTVAARAAMVQEPVDLLRLDNGLSARGGSALERALTVDTNTSQLNLDLLLDARRAGEATGSVAARSGAVPTDRPTLPMAESRRTLVPLGLQLQDSVTAPGGTERREWHASTPAAMLAGMHGANGRIVVGDRDPARAGQEDNGNTDAALGLGAQMMAETVQFLRENRFWLLGGVGVLALALAALQAFARRR